MVGQFTPPANTVYDSLATVTTGIDFTKCDLIEWQFRLTSDLRTTSSFVPVVIGGTTPTMEVPHGSGQISSYLANATDAAAGILKNVDCHVVAFETVRIRGWANATNGLVVPTGTTVATAYTVTINGGANGSFTGYEGIGPETFYLTMPQDQEIDAFPVVAGVTLRNRQAGMISVDRAVGGGNLALTGITFRATAPNSLYFGNWGDQAGDAGGTNGGHTCFRRMLRGAGITTANESLFTLSGGIYRVRSAITSHHAAGTWRTTSLLVDGTEVTFMRTGHDGGNWNGSSPLEWIVDASTVNRTVQVRRTNSSGNGNSSGWLAIERLAQSVVPDGVTARTPCNISINGGAAITLFGGTSSRVFVTVPNGQMINLAGVVSSAGLIVGVADQLTGALEIAVTEGTTTGTITVPFVAASANSIYSIINSGTWVNLGTIGVMVPASGNRSLQLRSNTGASIVCNYVTWLTWDGTRVPSANVTVTTTGVYLEASWSFGNSGNSQQAIISDVTNNRRYKVTMMINASYNNIHYIIENIT